MLLGAAAAVLGMAGLAVRPVHDCAGEPAMGRLLSVLWTGSVVAAAAAVWIGAKTGTGWSEEAIGLATGLAALATAVPMMFAHPRPLQHVVTFGAACLTAVTATALAADIDGFWFGVGALTFGLA